MRAIIALSIKTLIMYKTLIIYFTLFQVYGNAQQTWAWANNTSTGTNLEVTTVENDDFGFTYVAANYSGSLTVGNTTAVAVNWVDAYIAKYDPSGNLIWIVNLTGNGFDTFLDIVADNSGNVYVSGSFNSTVVTLGTQTLTGGGPSYNYFLAKINASGQVVWAKNSQSGNVFYASLALSQSELYLSAVFAGTLAAGANTLVSNGGNDLLLARYDTQGNLIWIISNGGTLDEDDPDLTIDATGNPVVCCGTSSGPISFGTFSVTGLGMQLQSSLLIVKYNNAGVPQWADCNTTVGGPCQITADNYGGIFVSGSFPSQAVLGTTTLVATGLNYFVAKYGSSGTIFWAVAPATQPNTSITGIECDGGGHIVLTGNFSANTLTLGAFVLVNDSTPSSMYVTILNNNGAILSAEKLGGKYSDNLQVVSVSSNGEIAVAGITNGKNTIIGTQTLSVPTSGPFVFVAKTSGSIFTNVPSFAEVNSNFKVFPNPTTSGLRIEPVPQEKIKLFNIGGQLILDTYTSGNIDLSELPSGLYILQLGSKSHKIIKN